MRNSFIALVNQNTKQFHQCASYECNVNPDDQIPVFYSYQHAKEEGWVFTSNPKFMEPGKSLRGVWVCPECISECQENQQ